MGVYSKSLSAVLLALLMTASAASPGIAQSESTFPVPWEKDRVSLYRFLQQQPVNASQTEPLESPELPDEEEVLKRIELPFAPGALDGAFGHHGSPGQRTDIAERVLSLLKAVLTSPSDSNVRRFYEQIRSESVIDYIDPYLERLLSDRSIDFDRLGTLMLWLASRAPDREAVKLSIGTLGFYQSPGLRDLLLTFGRHDEFTLYAVVALANNGDGWEDDIWQLAKSVHGWGRIQAVERLAETTNPEIKSWLLREGFRNTVLDEYLAYIAAENGGLLSAMRKDADDVELYRAAGDILHALINGGPAEDIRSYADGSEVTELFLRQSIEQKLTISDLVNLIAIQQYLSQQDYDWQQIPGDWSPERRNTMQDLARVSLGRESWPETIREALETDDAVLFYQANTAAKFFDIDTWDILFERQRETPKASYWYELMQTAQVARVQRVVALAATTLPLEEIAAGPSTSLGLSDEYWAHSALDFIVPQLSRFPGQGWVLLKAALRSPTVRNRSLAVNTLKAWPQSAWPKEALSILQMAEQQEPDPELKESLRDLIRQN